MQRYKCGFDPVRYGPYALLFLERTRYNLRLFGLVLSRLGSVRSRLGSNGLADEVALAQEPNRFSPALSHFERL